MRLLLAAAAISINAQATELPAQFGDELEAVRYGLKDPESARFRNVYETRGEVFQNKYRAVCGEVNAKNSYGGYIGFRPFVVFYLEDLPREVRVDKDAEVSWKTYCYKSEK